MQDLSQSDHTQAARELYRETGYGVLSTVEERTGYPFGSLVGYVPEQNGDCLIYISMIAEHWKNLAADPRASLLIANSWSKSPLSSARLTVLGQFSRCSDEEQQKLAELYRDKFKRTVPQMIAGNFNFLRCSVERLRWIGGFGQAAWIELSDWRAAFAAAHNP